MSWFGNRFKRLARSRAPIVLAASGVMVAWRFAGADTTANWQFPVNGNWTDNSIWSTHPDYPNNGTPLGVNYLANISVSGTYTNSLTSDIAIDGLTLNAGRATLAHSAGTLNLNAGTFDLTTGTYQLSGGTLSNGTLHYGGGTTLFQSGTLDNIHITGGDLNLDQDGSTTTIQNGLTIASHTINLSGSSSNLYIKGSSLSGNDMTITNFAAVTFDGPSQSWGSSTVNIPQASNAVIYVSGPNSGGPTTLLMGTHTTLSGVVTVDDYYAGSTLVNNGNINANVSVQPLSINTSNFNNNGLVQATNGGTLAINSPNWKNNPGGTLAASNNSTIILGGGFTTAGIGTTNISADSIVQIAGAMDNTTSTFTPGGGTWYLNGGSITNGTMNLAAGNFHVFFGTLDNVHVTGADLNLDQAGSNVTIQNGLTIDSHNINLSGTGTGLYLRGGSLSGNNLSITDYANVYFDGPSQMLDNSTIDIPQSNSVAIYVNGPYSGGSTTFTMGTQATLAGVATVYDYYAGSTLINNGNINANVSGQILSINTSNFNNNGLAQATNGASLTINSSNWTNNPGGTLAASNASTIDLGGTFTTAAIGTTSISADSTVNITGAMDNTAATFTAGAGTWFLNGGTITNGTVNVAPGNFHVTFGTLDHVHVTGGDLNLDQPSSYTTIRNGLTIDSHNINVSGSGSGVYVFGGSLSGNNLSITDYATIYFDGPSQMLDNSTINIPQLSNVVIYPGGPSSGGSTTFTMGTHATLSGAAVVYDYNSGSSLINNGTINANVSGATLTIGTSFFTNHGILKAREGATLMIRAGTAFTSDGSIDTSGGVLDNETDAHINGPASFATIVGQGRLLLGPGLSIDIAAGSAPSIQSALTLGTGTLLNIRNNNLTLSFGTGASPNSMIRNYISSGYNVSGTPWSGTSGITSSNAAADPAHRTVAFADGTDGVVTNLPVNGSAAAPFGGALPAGYELITYAYGGDGNLDGKVDFADFIILSNHFGTADTNWDHGNFNYDPSIDFADFIILSNNFGAGITSGNGVGASPDELARYNAMAAGFGVSQSQIAAWDRSIANIPEPGMAGMLVLGSTFFAIRRRKGG